MSTVYRAVRLWMKAAVELYFVDVQVVGSVPREGPLLLCCNHPNSLMDAIVLATTTRREVHFLAKSVLFRVPIMGQIFDAMGVIPVYRQHDDPTNTSKNEDSFRRVHEVLRSGGCIGIFPEGENQVAEDRQREIRSGAARMAMGAGVQVQVVPVGLNFTDRDRFFTGVLVRYGEPIAIEPCAVEQAQEAVSALTERIQGEMRTLAVHIEDELDQALVRDILRIYGGELRAALALEPHEGIQSDLLDRLRAASDTKVDYDDVFELKAKVVRAVTWFRTNDPRALDDCREAIRRYQAHLDQVALKEEFVASPPGTLSLRREAARLTIVAVAFAAPALFGAVHNAVPLLLTRYVARLAPDEAMRAFTKVVFGSFVYVAAYALYAWWARAAGWSWGAVAAYLLSLPPAGFIALRYLRQLSRYRDRILARVLFLTDRRLVTELAKERSRLLDRFDTMRARYLKAVDREDAIRV